MNTLSEFIADRTAVVQSLGTAANRYACVSDITQYGILPANVAEVAKQSIAEMSFRPRRLAFISGSALKSFQAQRLSGMDEMRSFSDLESAVEWAAAG